MGKRIAVSTFLISALLPGILSAEPGPSCLEQLIRPLPYRPGKNSFVVRLARGEKKTLLDLAGSGSVRHIWSTWSVEPGPRANGATGDVLLRVYLNGEAEPAIEGPLEDLFRAAEVHPAQGVPMPAFMHQRSFNLYLPLYFQRGIRIEAEAGVTMPEFYVQIDYRQTSGPERSGRLVSRKTPAGLRLEYVGVESEPPARQSSEKQDVAGRQTVRAEGDGMVISGPAVLKRVAFEGQDLDALQLAIFWDSEATPSVQAPLRYFFGGFTNAALESRPDQLTTRFPMPFRKQARLVLRGPAGGQADVSYCLEKWPQLPDDVLYFHARYGEDKSTTGYLPYVALQTAGSGHFVGINLFDTGHNHGGGDTALIDPGTESPRVLHGVCGEDYFGFAWHDTGRMTPLVGAPEHNRRYRLHLENPYTFRESLRFTFGTFAGTYPKSVAFWYQDPRPAELAVWQAVDVPWMALGPLGLTATLPERIDDRDYQSEVPIGANFRFAARWQREEMTHGFLDLTHHFRHYVLTHSGTGWLAGRSVMRLVTYVHSQAKQELQVRFGHDDAMAVALNSRPLARLPAVPGLRAAPAMLPLEAGWNELTVTLENDDNVDFRWNGLSLAVKTPAGIRFAARPQ